MASNYDDSDGVWRTIGGRRVFIKVGQSLSDAMKESGKFNGMSKSAVESSIKANNDDKKVKKALDELSKKDNITETAKGQTNTRSQIQEVAKASKEDYVTLDVETGKVMKFDKGYSVSFQQSSDNYTDEEFDAKVNECREKCDGKLYAGKYGGDAEPSFYTENLEDAKEIMYKYNQESIYDWKHGDFIVNEKYDASKNKTNADIKTDTESKSMNDTIRNEAYRKYMKEHPNSKMTLDKFLKNRKEK